MLNSKLYSAALACALGLSTVAQARNDTPGVTALPACSTSDLSFAVGSTAKVLDCRGFYEGNLSSSSTKAEITSALAGLGYAYDGNLASLEKLENLNGATTIDFATRLSGVTWIGIHFGAGNGSPGGDLAKKINSTAFYKLDAGSFLDKINLRYAASSNAVLYKTQPVPGNPSVGGVPEPDSWAMLIAGFGALGAARRRRKGVVVG